MQKDIDSQKTHRVSIQSKHTEGKCILSKPTRVLSPRSIDTNTEQTETPAISGTVDITARNP